MPMPVIWKAPLVEKEIRNSNKLCKTWMTTCSGGKIMRHFQLGYFFLEVQSRITKSYARSMPCRLSSAAMRALMANTLAAWASCSEPASTGMMRARIVL